MQYQRKLNSCISKKWLSDCFWNSMCNFVMCHFENIYNKNSIKGTFDEKVFHCFILIIIFDKTFHLFINHVYIINIKLINLSRFQNLQGIAMKRLNCNLKSYHSFILEYYEIWSFKILWYYVVRNIKEKCSRLWRSNESNSRTID